MRNQLFVPDFLFNFYNNRGSIGPDLENFTLKRLVLFLRFFFKYLIALYRKSRKPREIIFGDFGSRLRVVLKFIEKSTLLNTFRRQVVLQMCNCNCN